MSSAMIKTIVDQLYLTKEITVSDLEILLNTTDEAYEYLRSKARSVTDEIYGKQIYYRGLIEISNRCKNDCYYCGIRSSNHDLIRYYLDKDTILSCCKNGYELGFRTFVLQGGEDPYYTDEILEDIVRSIHTLFPDCAITLSLGERDKASYQRLYDAGANRYLLRHETADERHYQKLHPSSMSFQNRIQCLKDLKAIGYQVGCGFMVGSPYQNIETLYKDLMLIKSLQPEMVGIGPFISQCNTPFKEEKNGTIEMTIRLLSIIRLLVPNTLLPSTTALATLCHFGREKGILAGCNVVMPNLSPSDTRKLYSLYDHKASFGSEAAEGILNAKRQLEAIGYHLVSHRGDFIGYKGEKENV